MLTNVTGTRSSEMRWEESPADFQPSQTMRQAVDAMLEDVRPASLRERVQVPFIPQDRDGPVRRLLEAHGGSLSGSGHWHGSGSSSGSGSYSPCPYEGQWLFFDGHCYECPVEVDGNPIAWDGVQYNGEAIECFDEGADGYTYADPIQTTPMQTMPHSTPAPATTQPAVSSHGSGSGSGYGSAPLYCSCGHRVTETMTCQDLIPGTREQGCLTL